MKKVLLTLVAALFVLVAAAQSENAIIIDGKSFRPIQTDALTGVNIDPIQLDSSRRPCARIKVRINRMSKEDINGIEVKIITNNQLTKCRTAEYDNGLIVEMTAKPETRFYFYHPRLGYSNEVSVNLESNKEYRLDAYQNQQLSISVVSDVAGADVYLDELYRGQTTADKSFVIHNVTPGEHKLRIEYADKRSEQAIYVNSNKLYFVLNVLDGHTVQQPTAGYQKDNNQKATPKKKAIPIKKGLEQSVDMGYRLTISSGDNDGALSSLVLSYIIGYRMKSNLFIGGGVGIDFTNNAGSYSSASYVEQDDYGNNYYWIYLYDYNHNWIGQQSVPITKLRFPIFAHLKYNITKGNWQPFISLSAGGLIGGFNEVFVSQYPDRSAGTTNVEYYTHGVFAEPMVGVDFRMTNKCSINLQVGGIFQTLPNLCDTGAPYPEIKKVINCGFSLKLGFTF